MGLRGNPFRDVEDLLERIETQLSDVDSGGRGRPRMDVEDTGDRFVITADIPGFEKDDVTVEVRGDTLFVAAEHDEETKEELKEQYIRRERRHEAVERSLDLAAPVEEDAATATYENGVLRVELPKARRDRTTVDVE